MGYLDSTGLEHLVEKIKSLVSAGALTDATKKEIALAAHPVGSYYWSSESTDPGTLFGGTWTPIENRFVYAAPKGGAAGQTGGAATVALTAAQLAAHTHSTPNHVHHIGPHSHKLGAYRASQEASVDGSTYGLWSPGNGFNGRPLVGISSYDIANDADTSLSGEGDLVAGGGSTSGSTGSGQAHENMPPYITAYCWRRTA